MLSVSTNRWYDISYIDNLKKNKNCFFLLLYLHNLNLYKLYN